MSVWFKATRDFLDHKIVISSDNRKIFKLIVNQLPSAVKQSRGQPKISFVSTIRMNYQKTEYSKLPRSESDCFDNFSLFYNRFSEGDNVNLDAGPRTLRTVIDPKENKITSYIATPDDFEKDVLYDLIFFQPLKILLQAYDKFLLHASCAALGHQGVLFLGNSGSGKTTLALTLSNNDFEFVADDKIFLHPQKDRLICLSFPQKPKLTMKSLSAFPELRGLRKEGTLKEGKIRIQEFEKIRFKRMRGVMPKVVIFPRYKGSSLRLRPIKKQDALSWIAKEELMNIKFGDKKCSRKHFQILAELIRAVKTYRLDYQDKNLAKVPSLIRNLF